MSKSRTEVIQVGHWLKADTMFWINLTNLVRDNIIGWLKVYQLRQSRDHHQRVSKEISWPWFVHQLVSYYILAPLESFSYFFPIVNKQISQTLPVIPYCSKSFIDRVTHIELSPWMLCAVLPMRITLLVKLKLFQIDGAREVMIYLMRDSPNRHSISTKFFAEEVLMKLDQSINAILSSILNCLTHMTEVSFVKLAFLRLNSRPHNAQSYSIDSQLLKKFHVCFIEGRIIGWYFGDKVKPMKNQFCAFIIDNSTLSYMYSGPCKLQQQQRQYESLAHHKHYLLQIISIVIDQICLLHYLFQ